MADPYTDPVTGVLRNRLGFTDAAELSAAEREISALAEMQLGERPVRGGFDLAHLREVHRRLFEQVYPWAGQLRSVAIAKRNLFCLPQYIESESGRVFGQLAGESALRGLGRDRFVDRTTYYLSEVNAIHPFREGNGRAQRVFFTQLAEQAGWRLDFSGTDQRENVAASVASFDGDPVPLRDVLDRAVVGTVDPVAEGNRRAVTGLRRARGPQPAPGRPVGPTGCRPGRPGPGREDRGYDR